MGRVQLSLPALAQGRRRRRDSVDRGPESRSGQGEDSSQIEVVFSTGNSLLDFTGECEIQRSPNGCFCRKHGRPVERDAARCDSFVRHRAYEDSEDLTQRFIEEYVRSVLGIKKGRNYRKLVGWLTDAPSTQA